MQSRRMKRRKKKKRRRANVLLSCGTKIAANTPTSRSTTIRLPVERLARGEAFSLQLLPHGRTKRHLFPQPGAQPVREVTSAEKRAVVDFHLFW